jgi:hypothetical protein
MLLYKVGSRNNTRDPQYRDTSWRVQLMRLAARIAINRTVAGVHFPIDSAAGAMLGMTLGHYFVSRCDGSGRYWAYYFNSGQFPDQGAPPKNGDFFWDQLYDPSIIPSPTQHPQLKPAYAERIGAQQQNIAADPSRILRRVWVRALDEWK